MFLAADLGLAIEPRDDHAAYIASWLKALKNDKRLVFRWLPMPNGPSPSCTAQTAGKNSNEDVDDRAAV